MRGNLFTGIWALNQNCREKFCWDKQYHYICYYFDKFGRCTFGTYYEYIHMQSNEKASKKF